MINENCVKNYCCEDISLIENYDKAVADKTQTWNCHHRRETVLDRDDLLEIGEYWGRPACELIFLTKSEHSRLHVSGENNPNYGKTLSVEAKQKISEALKGENNPNYGKKFSVETRQKLSDAHIGKKLSAEHKQKLIDAHIGTKWWNNGIENKLAKECPEGFVAGQLKTTKDN